MKLNLYPKVIPKDTPPPPLTKGGVVVGMKKEGGKEKIYFVGDDCHLLCVGATRSGKSRCLVLESICLLGLAGESIFCSDPKAELFHYTSEFLKKLGYEVLVLDFKNPAKSMRYNLLQPVIDAINEGDTDRAEMLAWDLTNNLVGKPEGEKIWTNGECSIIAAAILCVVCDNQKRPEFQNMTNVYWFISEMCRTIGNKMPLLEYLKKQSPTHPARALLSISDVAPSRTRGSFYTSALTTLRLFTSKSIYSITHASDFTLTDLGRKKQALFVILPDEKTTFYPIASLIVSQQYELLAEAADKRGGRLERRVNFLLDEFGNFTPISDMTNKLTVAAGRGMRYALYVQGFDQLKEKYSDNIANTIKGNCQIWAYLQSDDPETLREMSDKLGSYTTSSYQLSASNGRFTTPSSSQSVSLTERKLLNTDEVRRVKRPYQIITSRDHPAMMYAPDLSKWLFNQMLGMGDMEHNRKLREERENKRPIITDTNRRSHCGISGSTIKRTSCAASPSRKTQGAALLMMIKFQEVSMKEKVKQTMGRLRKSVRAAGVGLSTLAASFFMSAPAYAAGVEDSQIVTGTEQLIGDLTTWLMVLAPVVSGLLIIYFCIRRGMADEMDQKKWNNRIVVAVVSCIGAVLGSATLNLILGYYQ